MHDVGRAQAASGSADYLAVPPKTTTDDSSLRIYVRRGAIRRFDKLKRDAAELPVVIEWDRRAGDRRSVKAEGMPDRRANSERRHEPPFTWKTADFVLVGSMEKLRDSGDPLVKRLFRAI